MLEEEKLVFLLELNLDFNMENISKVGNIYKSILLFFNMFCEKNVFFCYDFLK